MLRSLLALLVAALVACSGSGRAAPLPLSPDLELVPRDATAFIHFRVADIWKAEWMGEVRRLIDRAGPAMVKTFTQQFAPDPSTIDRVTLIMMTPRSFDYPFPRVDPEAVSALVVITTTQPYDRLRVMQALGLREKLYRRQLYYFNENLWSGLVLVDKHTFLIGSEDALVQFFDQQRTSRRTGPLQPALEEAARKHQLVIGINPPRFGKKAVAPFLPPPLQKLLEARCSTITVDLTQDIHVNLRLDYVKDDTAQEGEKALRATVELARFGLADPIRKLEKSLKEPPEKAEPDQLAMRFAMLIGLGLLREMDALLQNAPIKRQETAVNLDLRYQSVIPTNVVIVALAAITTIGRSASATFTKIAGTIGNGQTEDPHAAYFKKIRQALDKYSQEKGHYPPAAIYDKDGRPLLSWRVALLPYLGEEALYKEFHLDEPWDSLHNKKLIKKLPKAFQSPSYHSYPRLKTTTLVFTGDGTIFSDKKGTRKADMGDGAILLADTSSDMAVYWTKPADLRYADDRPLPKFFGKWGYQNLKVMLADGTLRTLSRETTEKSIRAMVKRGAKNDQPKKIEEKKEE